VADVSVSTSFID